MRWDEFANRAPELAALGAAARPIAVPTPRIGLLRWRPTHTELLTSGGSGSEMMPLASGRASAVPHGLPPRQGRPGP